MTAWLSTLSGTDSTLHACRLDSECGMPEREIKKILAMFFCSRSLAGYTDVTKYYWCKRCVVLQVCFVVNVCLLDL